MSRQERVWRMGIDPRRSAIRSHAYEMYREILSESESAIRTFYRLKRHRAYHEFNEPPKGIVFESISKVHE